jgi:Zn-dependent protease with chaperone function
MTREIQRLSDRISDVEKVKAQLAEFNFQTVTVVLAVLTLAAAIPIALFHGAQIASGQLAWIIVGLLTLVCILASIWLVLWAWLNFCRKGPR